MLPKNKQFSNFSKAVQSKSQCFRPDNEDQIATLMTMPNENGLLARGNGSSYSDCCLNDQGVVIDTSRFNHLLSFDEASGLLVCQGSVSFADLFLVHPDYIPPVIPGTLRATVAGGIANDVHGKNNHQQGSFGEHIEWIELEIGNQSYRCDRKTNAYLYHATIAGLGLTGFIKRIALKMRKASHAVVASSAKYFAWEAVLERMQTSGCDYDYQVAWLDLLNKPQALVTFANHAEAGNLKPQSQYKMPQIPMRFINTWTMKQFNRFYFNHPRKKEVILSLPQFNNPLDSIKNWTHLYGKNGLLQFQALFDQEQALSAIDELIKLIRSHQAIPTLAVLKYFTKTGSGLLSFAQPGFTLAIDFVNNTQSRQAIIAMNEWITRAGGKIYLAKDILLSKDQFRQQYPKHEEFSNLLKRYQSTMCSDMSKRLGISQ
ncbi:MAG: FAD-binding oxidoreductase [Tatlockia sp.]|nr:FAD-binding oxidoreductase [Tatlockia sp.]